ncbi:hypothetical protein [Chitinivorax sp. B]|uniref:hypothetical protein n=1 Tax=Chitinivorax sp. B TaxID=2502235 RepID=UPI0010F9D0E0|nr:hypothetical protein [Chitinivorax sp. B]
MHRNHAHIIISLLLAVPIIGQVHAGWFSTKNNDDVSRLTPDGIVRLTFLNRATLGFDPAKLHITAIYEASKPDEKGVRKETRKSRSCPKIPVPFGCTTHKYQIVVQRSVVLDPGWLSSMGPSTMVIRVPESLAGPGAYRLTGLQLPCFDEACNRGIYPNAIPTLTMQLRTQPASRLADALHIRTTFASSVFSAAYEGKQLALVPAGGSQAALTDSFRKDEIQKLRVLQDKEGQWHISPNALIELFGFYGSCSEPWVGGDPELVVKPDQHPDLAWAKPFAGVAHSRVYDSPQMNRLGEMQPVHLGNWTGCVAIKAEGIPEQQGTNEEVRYYGFEEGRLIYRRRQTYNGRVSASEWIEIDGDKRPLFVERSEYRHDLQREKTLRWSRLVETALPNRKQDTISVDVAALIREGEAVKKVIAHSFVRR